MAAADWWRNPTGKHKHQLAAYPWCLITAKLWYCLGLWHLVWARVWGGQWEQGALPEPWCGRDYPKSGSLQITRSSQLPSRFSSWDFPVHLPWPTPGHALLAPWAHGARATPGTATRLQHMVPAPFEQTLPTLILCKRIFIFMSSQKKKY